MGRNVLRGTSQSNVDCSLVKRFPIRESRTVEFRSDFVNLFNQANRNNPIRDISGVTATGGSVFLSRQLRAASWLEFQLETARLRLPLSSLPATVSSPYITPPMLAPSRRLKKSSTSVEFLREADAGVATGKNDYGVGVLCRTSDPGLADSPRAAGEQQQVGGWKTQSADSGRC